MAMARPRMTALVISPSAVMNGSRNARAKHSRERCMMKPMAKPARMITARTVSFSSPEVYHWALQASMPTNTPRPSSG